MSNSWIVVVDYFAEPRVHHEEAIYTAPHYYVQNLKLHINISEPTLKLFTSYFQTLNHYKEYE